MGLNLGKKGRQSLSGDRVDAVGPAILGAKFGGRELKLPLRMALEDAKKRWRR